MLLHTAAADPEWNEETRLTLTESARKFETLYHEAEDLEVHLSEECRRYFGQFLKYQIKHMLLLSQWCAECLVLMDKARAKEQRLASGADACACLEAILEERKVLEQGPWENWHRGDKKINISRLLTLTKIALDQE